MLDIRDIIENKVNGATFASLDTLTRPVLLGGKKNPHQNRVFKACIGSNVMLFSNKRTNAYDAMVKRRLESVGMNPEDFVLSPRTWGERLPNEPVVTHKGQFYLEVIFRKAGRVQYYLDCLPVAKSAIQGLPDKDEAEQGGLPEENKVVIRTFKFDSIWRVAIDGKVFEDNRIVLPMEVI